MWSGTRCAGGLDAGVDVDVSGSRVPALVCNKYKVSGASASSQPAHGMRTDGLK